MTPIRKQLLRSIDELRAQALRVSDLDPHVLSAAVRVVDIHAARVIAEQEQAKMNRALGGGR